MVNRNDSNNTIVSSFIDGVYDGKLVLNVTMGDLDNGENVTIGKS